MELHNGVCFGQKHLFIVIYFNLKWIKLGAAYLFLTNRLGQYHLFCLVVLISSGMAHNSLFGRMCDICLFTAHKLEHFSQL